MAGASYDRYNAYVALPQIEKDVSEVKELVKKSSGNSSCPFPVGSVLLFNDSTDPNETWTGTEWSQIAGDSYLVGAGQSHSVGTTGGSNTHTLSAEEMPAHTHTIGHGHDFTQPTVNGGSCSITSSGSHTHTAQGTTHKFQTGGTADRYHLATSGALSGFILSTGSDHTHTVPEHTHSVSGGAVTDASGNSGSTGGNGGTTTAFSIEPSYYTVCIWERTA